MNHVDFASQPAIGTILELDSQQYELAEASPYIRADGKPTTLLEWVTECPDCGESFSVVTGLVANSLPRRCRICRAHTRKPVKGKRGRKVRISVIEP